MGEDPYRNLRVVVTGAASGMGAATIELLLAQGAEVHAVDVRPARDAVAKTYHCDLADGDAVAELVDALPAEIDCTFLCAGLSQTSPADQVVAVNFLSTRELVRSVAPRTPATGAIAVVASATYGWERMYGRVEPLLATHGFDDGLDWWREHGDAAGDPYVFSKFAITAYCVDAAIDLASRGVRLNVLGPGTTDTPMLTEFEAALGSDAVHSMPRPLDRLSTADEQARALLFLNDPANRSLTGAVLFNDAGMSAALATARLARATIT